LYSNPKPFKEFDAYTFSNPLNTFSSEHTELSNGVLDSLGRMNKQIKLADKKDAPGMLQANIIARIREAGGDESFAARSVRYSPYRSYVGISLGEKEFETDKDLNFPVVCVNAEGKLQGKRKIEYKVYRLNWNWWREGSPYALNRYVQSTSAEVVASGKLESADGRTQVPFRVDYPDWGKYLVFVRDTQSGHATGGVVFIDWPEWRGHAGKKDAKASSMLSFALDKRNYEVGETATVYLPKSAGGRVLLSVENASKVLSRRWVTTSATRETSCKIHITREMAPNFYVHATLLQPHAKSNDLPIRMYGVEGAEVINRHSILHPEIEMADEIRPQQEFTIKVRERDCKPMTYTLAIVDEGLLDITSFRTPQPWRAMNQREALGVKTWDLYDDVIGAYAGTFTKILSVGGDEALRRTAGKEKRFNPVVKFLGPFTLRSGQATHKVTLPMYVGSVRVMVVAAHEATYGHADKTVTVRSPLMLLPTLPRILSCGDHVKLPVNVFCMDDRVQNTEVKISVKGPVSVAGSTSKNLTFATPAEQLTSFDLVCDNVRSGQAKITITADGGGHTASETIYIDVRNPLPPVITNYAKTLHPGEEHDFTWTPFTDGTAQLEVGAMPKIDFSGAFVFMENYGHYCTEQLSARAMYMLYARRFLSAAEQAQAREALPKILKTIFSRQTSEGGFVYWPGSDVNEWATSMAGEVMLEARRQGFAVADQYINRWKKYQQQMARTYRHSHEHGEDMVQAYRLHTLVKSGEEPVAAMNRLRESGTLSYQALMRLAVAYAEAGKVEVTQQLIGRTDNCV
ncbi:MAG: alpha-2-macroglobulin, partial [Bacteroidaceae bacterium]|nr:alpha-2-macroglobulin [Bacteroidaceae bacterium]